MKKAWVKGWALTACAPLAFSSACMFAEPSTGQQEAEEIIGGFPARSPQLDLVGALAFPLPEDFDPAAQDGAPEELASRPYYNSAMELREGDTHFTFCTGTLIAPNAVLTAEHCVADLFGDEEFVFGFNGKAPDRAVKITGAVAEETITGGAIGLGADVAIAFLEEPVEDVGVASIGTFSDEDIGTQYVNIGYGVQNNNEDSGTRYLGAVTLRGLAGNIADHLFGDFEGYLEHFPELGLPEDQAEALYEMLVLIEGYEATLGNDEGNAQSCFGDSGGPVMRKTAEGFEVYGVTSWGLGSEDLVCDWGGVYGVFGPAVQEFIDRSLACELVPEEGMCAGDVATRCAGPDEGGWKVVETDCTEAGQICGTDDAGEVACVADPCEDVPEDGMCEGDTAVRCTEDDEGQRRVVETDCSLLGLACGVDEDGARACVDPSGE